MQIPAVILIGALSLQMFIGIYGQKVGILRMTTLGKALVPADLSHNRRELS